MGRTACLSSITTTFTLDNGLKVILKPLHTAPIVSQWLWYRHGARDEPAGQTGQAHWIEHMLFKGTPRYPHEQTDRMIDRAGGIWNAFTSLDWTTYFITLPAEHVDLMLAIEADRMVNAPFRPKDVTAERTVILAEMEGALNDPYARLSDTIQAAAFRLHPYGHPVIGHREDLLATTRDALYARYQQYYRPNNAVLAIAGHFEVDAMRARIQEHFASLPAAPIPKRSVPAEPPLTAAIEHTLRGPDQTPFLQIAYRTPAFSHPDTIPLHILASFLVGPVSLGVLGGSLSNKTSYLYQQLVRTGQIVGVHGSMPVTLDPFLFTFGLTLPPGAHPRDAWQAFDQALQPILEDGLQPSDLQRAIRQTRALFAYDIETITQQASWLGYQEIINSPDLLTTYLARLEQVTLDDILQAAQTWLHPQNRIIGMYIPEKQT